MAGKLARLIRLTKKSLFELLAALRGLEREAVEGWSQKVWPRKFVFPFPA
jgi:hypothetical protein